MAASSQSIAKTNELTAIVRVSLAANVLLATFLAKSSILNVLLQTPVLV